jgi:hypothetical protein
MERGDPKRLLACSAHKPQLAFASVYRTATAKGRWFLLLLLSMAAGCLWGQQPPPTVGNESLDGTVVNGATGEGIPRALVHLNGPSTQMTISGTDGRFEFHNLPKGRIMVLAQKPGFYNTQQLGRHTPPKTFQIGQASGIKVTLYPSGVLSGRVTTAAGDPIEGIVVRTMYQHVENGAPRWQQRNSAITDDAGEYRIANLIPGKYLVATETRPVRTLSPQIRSFGENFDEVYAGQYFPGGPDASSASTIQVLPGQTAEASFSEPIVRAYSVSGTVTADTPSERLFLSLRDRDGNQVTARLRRKGEQFQFFDVAPGEYSLFVTAMGNSNRPMYGQTSLAVNNADLKDVSVALFPAASLHIGIGYQDGAAGVDAARPPGELVLIPRAQGGFTNSHSVPLAQTATGFDTPRNISPGVYRVEFLPSGNWYVADIRSGGTDLRNHDLVITPGAEPEPIQVTLAGNGATITGSVKGADGIPAISILAIPDSGSTAPPRVYNTAPQISISGLAPGAYHLYAFTSIEGLAYRDSETMRKYNDKAVAVNVSAQETKQIELPIIGGSEF